MFNTPSFSGAPGTTTLNVSDNGANGVSVLTGSGFTIIHQAMLNSTNNKGAGVFVDNGSSVTLIQSTLTGNAAKDLSLTFGSRADLTGSKIGVVACDASTLVRGDTGITCPRSQPLPF